MTVDLLIVGAGAAGLGAFHAACQRGLTTAWVEAKDRVGGRACTDTRSLPHPFDLGAHWLHEARANPLVPQAARLGLSWSETGTIWAFHDCARFLIGPAAAAGTAAWDGLIADAARAVAGADPTHPQSLAQLVARQPAAWQPYQTRFIAHVCAAPPSAIAASDPSLALVGEDWPIATGYGDLIARLIAEAGARGPRLNTAVTVLDLSARDHVRAETAAGAICARAVVVTASTAVLRSGRLRLAPGGWPLPHLRALEATPTGSATRIALALTPGKVPPELHNHFIHCLVPDPQNISWHLQPHGFDMAVAYLGGGFSRALSQAGPAAQLAFARDHLEGLFGARARDWVTAGTATPFDRDPWIGGGYSYARADLGCLRQGLSTPIEGRVMLAGEACSIDQPTTAHGAYRSGQAAVAAPPAPQSDQTDRPTPTPGVSHPTAAEGAVSTARQLRALRADWADLGRSRGSAEGCWPCRPARAKVVVQGWSGAGP